MMVCTASANTTLFSLFLLPPPQNDVLAVLFPVAYLQPSGRLFLHTTPGTLFLLSRKPSALVWGSVQFSSCCLLLIVIFLPEFLR